MAKEPAVQLAPGVWRIPLIRDLVNGFMLRDDDQQVTLIDMGVPKSGPKVMAALASIGSGPSDVTRLMLTHAHADHAGAAAYVARQTGRFYLSVLAGLLASLLDAAVVIAATLLAPPSGGSLPVDVYLIKNLAYAGYTRTRDQERQYLRLRRKLAQVKVNRLAPL